LVGSQHLAHIVGKLCVMELVLMGCIWSVPRHVQAARSELVNISTITNAGGQPVNGHSTPAHAVGKLRAMKLVLTGCRWDDVEHTMPSSGSEK